MTAGVGYQDVYLAELVVDLLQRCPYGYAVGSIGLHHQTTGLVSQRAQWFPPSAHDRNIGAF